MADLDPNAAAQSPQSAPQSAPQSESPATEAPDAARLQTLERENADLKDRLLRALAEMENLRRRTEREILDARAYAITKFASDMISTADNLSRALESLPKSDDGAENAERAALKPMIEGVELTARDLGKALEKHGVKKRAPVGERFDPHKDQAVFEIPDETVASGTVLQVMQPGYMIGERVLRASMVGVSRGGPARAPEAAKPEEAAAPEPVHEPRPTADPHAKPKFDKRA